MSNNITCPHCGNHFSLSDIQSHEMGEFRQKMEKEQKEREEKFAKQMEEKTEEMRKKAQEFAQKKAEEALEKAKKESEEKEKKIVEQLEQKYKKESLQLEEYKKRDEENKKRETEFLKKEIEFENFKNNFELEKKKIELEVSQRERKKMEEEFTLQLQEKMNIEAEKVRIEHEKQLRAKEEQIAQIQKSLDDANRKMTQWSMQIQWELQENALKEILSQKFPFDIISDVEKWIKWADIIQEVRNEFGQSVWIIAWESKNTKNWEDKWISKMKEDRLRVNAELSIIVSRVLPKGIEKFGIYEWIWVVDWAFVNEIAIILRSQLIQISAIQNSVEWREEKLEVIFNYLTSAKFKDKIENILTAFREMQDQVVEERKAFEARWKKRETLLENVIKNTSWMYGDLSWILWSKLQKVDYLELWSWEL